MSDLGYTAAFNLARLGEDEAVARAATRSEWLAGPADIIVKDADPHWDGACVASASGPDGAHIARNDPASRLRGIAAGRTIVAACTRAAEADPNSPAGALALAVLEAMSTEWEHMERPFVPDWTISPGVLLRRALEAQGKNAEDILGARRIIDGTLRIGPFEAGTIAAALGTSEDMWLNAQRLYDAAILRGATDTSGEYEQDDGSGQAEREGITP